MSAREDRLVEALEYVRGRLVRFGPDTETARMDQLRREALDEIRNALSASSGVGEGERVQLVKLALGDDYWHEPQNPALAERPGYEVRWARFEEAPAPPSGVGGDAREGGRNDG